MTDTIDVVIANQDEPVEPMASGPVDQQEVAEQLFAQAKAQGVELVGPNGLLNQLTKRVPEEEMPATWAMTSTTQVGRDRGNPATGVRSKTVLTEIGPVEIEVPRDTDTSFQPQMVKKRQRRLTANSCSGCRTGRCRRPRSPTGGHGPVGFASRLCVALRPSVGRAARPC